MAEPTLVSYGNSTLTDTSANNETVAGVSWQTGDRILVFGFSSNNAFANMLATPTVTGLTGTGLTFSLVTSVNNDNSANDCPVLYWSATAAGNGSGTIQSVPAGGLDGALRQGIVVVVYRGSDGLGTPVLLDGSTAKTISLTRVQANSHVVVMLADYQQVGDVTVTATPTGTVRLADAEAGQADYFFVTFGDQSATGTTAYGIANHTGTVRMSGIAVEVKGTAGGGQSNAPRAMNSYRQRRAA